MSLYDTITAATSGVVPGLLSSAGVPCRVRVAEPLDNQDDNSTAVHWRTVPGLPDTVPVVLSPMSEQARRYGWGEQADVSIGGTVALQYGLTVGHILRPTVGSFTGQYLKVIASRPSDLGSLTELAMRVVPSEQDFGF